MNVNDLKKEKIILGIDPGTKILGYGIIKTVGSQAEAVTFGVLNLSKYTSHEIKLKKIFERISQLINEYLPDEMAIEAPFYGVNVQSMLKLGRVQGVAMAAALAREIPIVEYLPKQVKQSVTGNGNATKEQVAYMLDTILKTKIESEFFDATDALGVAVCHHHHSKTKALTGNNSKKKGWAAFLSENPDRKKS